MSEFSEGHKNENSFGPWLSLFTTTTLISKEPGLSLDGLSFSGDSSRYGCYLPGLREAGNVPQLLSFLFSWT